MRNLFVYFTAGCIGAVANSIVMWFFGDIGITKAAGVAIAPVLNAQWLYPRIVWGGIWGLIFVLPIFRASIVLKGSLLSLLPSIVALFIILPDAGQGMAGMRLGAMTPVFVVFFNWIWGVMTAAAIRAGR
jgi:hypothetical protein